MVESANNMKTMLVNINGLSQHSKTVLENYIENEQIDVLSLCETNKLIAAKCFKNFLSYSSYLRKVATLSIRVNQSSTEVIELTNEKIDSIFALVETNNETYLVETAYIPSDDREALKSFLKTLTAC